MAEDPKRTMWATTERDNRRYFHIPEGVDLAAGALVLRTLKGDKREVDPAAVTAYEIDEEAAKALVQAEMVEVAKKASTFLTNAAAAMRGAIEKPAAPADPAGQASAEFNFASVLGMTPDEVRANPEKAIEALKTTFQGLTGTLRDAMQTDDPAAKASAKQRMEAVSAYLARQGGGEFAGTVETLPERLKAFLSNPDLEKRLKEASDRLTEAAAELRSDVPQGVNRRE